MHYIDKFLPTIYNTRFMAQHMVELLLHFSCLSSWVSSSPQRQSFPLFCHWWQMLTGTSSSQTSFPLSMSTHRQHLWTLCKSVNSSWLETDRQRTLTHTCEMILEWDAILSAVLTASSTKDSAGNTRDTRPHSDASWAVMGVPVRFISMALHSKHYCLCTVFRLQLIADNQSFLSLTPLTGNFHTYKWFMHFSQ